MSTSKWHLKFLKKAQKDEEADTQKQSPVTCPSRPPEAASSWFLKTTTAAKREVEKEKQQRCYEKKHKV